MSHPLKGKFSIDVDDQIGLGNLASAKIAGKSIPVAFFEPVGAGGDAPRGTKETLDTWRGFGFGRLAGLRFVPHNWAPFSGLTGSQAAKKCSDMIAALETDGVRRVDVVEWDIETKDAAWSKEFLLGSAPDPNNQATWTKGIRGRGGFLPDPTRTWTLGYRWGRPGVWTMESRQDASTGPIALAAETGLLIGPQCYNGAMTEMYDLWYEIETWVRNENPERPNGARIPITSIIPYYDVRKSLMPVGANEAVLFATSRLNT